MSKNNKSKTATINQYKPTDEMLCSFGGMIRTVPHAMVKAIEPIQQAAPIPYSTECLEGLVSTIDGLSPQFNLAKFLGANPNTAKYSLIISTPKGLVRVTADAVLSLNTEAPTEPQSPPSIVEDIEALLTTFKAAPVQVNHFAVSKSIESETHQSILLIKVGNQTFGINGQDIELIERHATSIPLSSSNDVHRVISLHDGRLIGGVSSSLWLNIKDVQAEDEGWSIGYANNGHTIALTVSDVIGLEPIENSKFYKLLHGDKVTEWVNHPSIGAIEVLNIKAILLPKLHAASKDIESNQPNQDAPSIKNTPTAQQKSGLGLELNGFRMVIPQELVKSVNTRLSLASLKRKPWKKTLPVFDLLKISNDKNMAQDAMVCRSATIQADQQTAVILTAHEVYEPDDLESWLPTPLLPSPLSEIVQGIRIKNHQCELLLEPQFMSKMSAEEIHSISEQTFAGWQKISN